jgi:uncharacterized small protein (DUF1192 family)
MKILKPRSRTIGVRLSEEEFVALQRLCISSGARSVSDFARKAMQDFLERTEGKHGSALEESEYMAQLKNLEHRVGELAAELARFKAQKPQDDATHSNGNTGENE